MRKVHCDAAELPLGMLARTFPLALMMLAVALAGCSYGPPCPPTRTYAPEGGGEIVWCGFTFHLPAQGGSIEITGNATETVLWDQLSIIAPPDVHIAVNADPTRASPAPADDPNSWKLNLGRLQGGAVKAGDSIRLCGPGEVKIVLDQAAWPYAGPKPWTMRLPACPPG